MIDAIQKQVNKGLGQIRQAFLGLVSRGGSSSVQLKGYTDEVLEDVEVIQHVGFASYIPEEVKVVLIPQQGKTSKAVIVATKGGAIVVDVATGETCIYDQFGHSVWLKEDGTHIKGDLFVDGNIESTKNIKANGQVQDHKGTMQQIRDTYNGHVHGSSSGPNKAM
ncbi:phage baseplate assembly protein [Acinetobacter johnsonii]|uniref:phage baseplate assembly protein domain-containing protein n=1 Tax=Acinetobacter johnsonii TaxID=40214 RepID=UPI0024478451|nr:phage baseplate assembly protein [Acinetobacter johnsonii]MDH1068456.1 phage baseplate assembly protein [Acinetobacter johnsonii]